MVYSGPNLQLHIVPKWLATLTYSTDNIVVKLGVGIYATVFRLACKATY